MSAYMVTKNSVLIKIIQHKFFHIKLHFYKKNFNCIKRKGRKIKSSL